MVASVVDSDAIIFVGQSGDIASGWSATLESMDRPSKVRLADVFSWPDIADHAATYEARVVVRRSVQDAMRRTGTWCGPSTAPNTVVLDS